MRKHIKEILYNSSLFPVLREWEQVFNAYLKRVHEGDYHMLPKDIDGGLIADIGANLGQSAISFRRLFPSSKIVAFEPNPACIETLKRVSRIVGGEVDLKNMGLGDESGVLDFYVPVIRDRIELLQEGSFDRDCFDQPVTINRISEKFHLAKLQIDISKLDDFDYNFKLMKIDVQGLEYQVLRGAERTIQQHKPVIIIEKDERHNNKIYKLMEGFGYRAMEGVTNFIYIHSANEGSRL